MSARRKQDAVVRLLRGEDLELLSRELAVTAAELSGWREAFLAGGEASLKSRPADARDAEIGRLKEKVGDLTIARSSAAIHFRRNQGQEALAGLTSCSRPRSSGWRFPAPYRPAWAGRLPAAPDRQLC
jgi:transposase